MPLCANTNECVRISRTKNGNSYGLCSRSVRGEAVREPMTAKRSTASSTFSQLAVAGKTSHRNDMDQAKPAFTASQSGVKAASGPPLPVSCSYSSTARGAVPSEQTSKTVATAIVVPNPNTVGPKNRAHQPCGTTAPKKALKLKDKKRLEKLLRLAREKRAKLIEYKVSKKEML